MVGVFDFSGVASAALVAVASLLSVIGFVWPATAQADIATFGFTGARQTFVVPAAVTSVRAVAVGAPGGSARFAAGGHGALMAADVSVTPGETLYVEVGGPGAGYADCCATGGFNGGGFGASFTFGTVAGSSANGGGGGGASDVRTVDPSSAGSLNSRLVVAAGGGGGGGGDDSGAPSPQYSPGGDAGAPADPTGACVAYCGGAGGAGTATAGGAGGPAHNAPADPSGLGAAGQFGLGGRGGAGGLSGGGAGGGGGGYYGGGGGSGTMIHPGGGGGGGSSFSVNEGTPTIDTSGVPSVSISYVPVPTAELASPSLAFGSVLLGQSSSEQTVTISNHGSAPLQITNATVTGLDATDFAVGFGCAGAVAPAGHCSLPVRFAPHATGRRSATLTIATNASGPARAVLLSGVGAQPSPGGLTSRPVLKSAGTAHLTTTKSAIRLVTGQRVTCPAGQGSCQVTVVLRAKGSNKLLGRLNRTIRPGKTLVLTLTINHAGRALLSHASRITATLTTRAVKGGRVATVTRTVTLRRPRAQ